MRNIYFGAFTTNDLTDVTLTSLHQFEHEAKKTVSIVMWYQDWEPGYNESFNLAFITAVRNNGAIPMITWEPYQPGLTDPANQPKYALANIIGGKFDTYITQFAQAAKAWGYPFFLRFAHEMNGNWYPWSEQVNGNQRGQYVQAWQHVHDIFTSQGVTNVTWVWSPNVIAPQSTPLPELYPGDAYVDWVGMDGYNWGNTQNWSTWTSFTDIFQATYNQILTITQKPMIVCETASTELGGSKALWITNMLTRELINNFPALRGFIWFNLNKETDWRIESSHRSQMAFANGIAQCCYRSANIRSLTQGVIPTP